MRPKIKFCIRYLSWARGRCALGQRACGAGCLFGLFHVVTGQGDGTYSAGDLELEVQVALHAEGEVGAGEVEVEHGQKRSRQIAMVFA